MNQNEPIFQNLYIRDPLTGLYNRRGMARQGREVLENVQKIQAQKIQTYMIF